MTENRVLKSYKATGAKDPQANYDEWAQQYEQDLCAMGYRLPAAAAAAFARFVPLDTSPILDAGCGGGLQAEPLAMLGYGPLIGMDLSEGMLAVARQKGIYDELHQGALGPRLDLPDNSMGAVLCIGTITPNHAPPESLDGLVRVARPGAPIIFSLRDDCDQEPAYPNRLAALSAADKWVEVWSSPSLQSMPYGAEAVTHRIHVFRKAMG